MKYQVIISPKAERNFDRITQYLLDNDFNIAIAAKIKDEISDKLSIHPLSGRLVDDPTDELRGVRQIQIMRKNIVFYEVNNRIVKILTIRAGGMNAKS